MLVLLDINLAQPGFGACADNRGSELLHKVGVLGAVREENFHGAFRHGYLATRVKAKISRMKDRGQQKKGADC